MSSLAGRLPVAMPTSDGKKTQVNEIERDREREKERKERQRIRKKQ